MDRKWWNPLTWTPLQSLLKAITPSEAPTPALVDNGASFGGEYGRGPRERPLGKMAQAAGHPTLWTVVTRRAADSSSLPLKLTRGGTGPHAEKVESHPILDLMEEPSSTMTGLEMRRQLMVDLMTTGMAYLLKVRPFPGAPPVSLIRVHPEKVKLVTQRMGSVIQAVEVDLDGEARHYRPEDVIIFRYPSWERGPWGLFGQGIVSALALELSTDRKARAFINRNSGTVSLDVLIQPLEDGDEWNQVARERVADSYRAMARKGGPFVLSGRSKVETLGSSPKDSQAREVSQDIRREVMSAGQTPPVIMGAEVANYATARQQDAIYWRGIMMDTVLIDKRLTISLVRDFPDARGLHLSHDFSGVLALQGERTEQVKRAHLHIKAGATPAQAYAYEGLPDAPVPDVLLDLGEGEEGGEAALEVPAAGTDKSSRAPVRVEKAEASPWARWVRKYQAPSERRLRLATQRYLKGASARYQKRVAEAMGKAMEAQDIRKTANGWSIIPGGDGMVRAPVFDDGVKDEAGRMMKAIGPAWRAAWVLALKGGVRDLGVDDVDVSVDFPEDQTRALYGVLSKVSRTTAAQVQVAVETGLMEGWSVGQIQEAIRQSVAFSPARALTIARTESTRAVNAGTLASYTQAQDQGVDLRKVWLTAEDEAVRDSHQEMDGQTVGLDEDFLSGDGNPTEYPGGFSVAEEDINCRCALSAEVV